jgi:hypothetical protein
METIRTVVTWIFGILSIAALLALTENFKELLKQWGGNTLLVRIIDKLLPVSWHNTLSWKYLRALWWLWLIFGVSGGVAIALWLTPFLSASSSSTYSEDRPTGIRDHHHGGTEFKGLGGMQWGLATPAPVYLYSVADNIYATDFFARGMNVTDQEITLDTVFIQSGMTSARLPMLINIANDWVQVNKINPIPPHAEFDLTAILGGTKGIPMTEFLKQWGTFTFVARYGGNEFKEHFDEQAVAARFSMLHPLPHVTRRQD